MVVSHFYSLEVDKRHNSNITQPCLNLSTPKMRQNYAKRKSFDIFPKNRFYISKNGKVHDSYQDCINLVKKFSTPIRKKSSKPHTLSISSDNGYHSSTSSLETVSQVKKCEVEVNHIFPGAQGASFGQMSRIGLNCHKLNRHKLNHASLENNSENNRSQAENEIAFKMEKAVSGNTKEIQMESVKSKRNDDQASPILRFGNANKAQNYSHMTETITNVQGSQSCQEQPIGKDLQDIGFVSLSEMSGSYASSEMKRPPSNDAQAKKSEGLVNGFIRKKSNLLFL